MKHHTDNKDDKDPMISGRLNRLSYFAWMAVSIFLFAIIDLMLASEAVITISGKDIPLLPYPTNNEFAYARAILVLFKFVILMTLVFLSIRRTHDFGKSGWWVLVLFIPIINLYLFLKKGDSANNNFGAYRLSTRWEILVGWISIFLFVLVSLLLLTKL